MATTSFEEQVHKAEAAIQAAYANNSTLHALTAQAEATLAVADRLDKLLNHLRATTSDDSMY